jgi:predicted metal-dependent hydrolase
LRSKRRTIGFLVSDEGLRVTAPKWVTLAEIDNAIREKQRWILTKLNERRERSARRLQPQMQWRDGATLPYLGSDITLRIRTGQRQAVFLDEVTRELNMSLPADAGEQQLKDRVQGWLQARAEELFGKRLMIYAEKLGVRYRSFALSSATALGLLHLGRAHPPELALMHFALPLIDYVIAHELAHLREMNHSPRFWATVQSIFPEFESAKKACATAHRRPCRSSERRALAYSEADVDAHVERATIARQGLQAPLPLLAASPTDRPAQRIGVVAVEQVADARIDADGLVELIALLS